MKRIPLYLCLSFILAGYLIAGCGGAPVSKDDIVRVEKVQSGEKAAGIGESERRVISRLRQSGKSVPSAAELESLDSETQTYTIEEYFGMFQEQTQSKEFEYVVGANDVLSVIVYDEPDLTRKGIRVARDGTISFPLLGRVKVGGLNTSSIEDSISNKLAEGQFMLDAQVSVMIDQYGSKKYQILGEIRKPGSYPLKAEERLLDAISAAGGAQPDKAGKELLVIRTINQQKDAASGSSGIQQGGTAIWGQSPTFSNGYAREKEPAKIVITVDLDRLLRGNDLISNLALHDNDVIYLPKAKFFYIMGQVKQPGSYKFTQKDLTLVGAIGSAGGFTNIAARNKTRIIRVENGEETIITVNVDAITSAGRKIQDVRIKPEDIIIVPESFF